MTKLATGGYQPDKKLDINDVTLPSGLDGISGVTPSVHVIEIGIDLWLPPGITANVTVNEYNQQEPIGPNANDGTT